MGASIPIWRELAFDSVVAEILSCSREFSQVRLPDRCGLALQRLAKAAASLGAI